MSHAAAFTAARAAVATLDVNPLWGHEKQTAEVRKDVGRILDELEAAIAAEPEEIERLRIKCAVLELDKEKILQDWHDWVFSLPTTKHLSTIGLARKRIEKALSYAERNPLGGPAVIFDAMADRVRAGENFYDVLRDHGFTAIGDARCPYVRGNVTKWCALAAEPSFALSGGVEEQVDYCKELPE